MRHQRSPATTFLLHVVRGGVIVAGLFAFLGVYADRPEATMLWVAIALAGWALLEAAG